MSAEFHFQQRVSVVIPTRNAGPGFDAVLRALRAQDYDGGLQLVVIDSSSTDATTSIAAQNGADVIRIPASEFDHGLTRNRAIDASSGHIVVLMSQDALPGDSHLIGNLVNAFRDPQVAGAYARQIPRDDADVLTKRNLNSWLTARRQPEIRWIRDRSAYDGLSAMQRYYFCNFDDVCSAIRKSVWRSIPFRANQFGEDIEWAKDVLEAGWKIAYCPDSYVVHSHVRSFRVEYDRTRLCHKKLSAQFGIRTVPSWRHVLSSTIYSTKDDETYMMHNEKRWRELLKLLFQIPLLSFASVYGQYRGAREGYRSGGWDNEHCRAHR